MSKFLDDRSVGRAASHFDTLIRNARNDGAFASGNPLLTLIAKEIDEIAMRQRIRRARKRSK